MPVAARRGALLLHCADPRVPALVEGCSLPNPLHRSWLLRGCKGKEPPKRVSCVVEMGDHLAFPRETPIDGDVDDRTVYPEASRLAFQPGFGLRPIQIPMVEAFAGCGGGANGLGVAACGAGKTVMAAGIIAAHPTPALVVVPANDLLDQAVETVERFLGCTPTVMGGGRKEEPSRVTVATFQTLARMDLADLEAWASHFGLAIFDEVQHLAAETLMAVTACIPARVRVGLTATPERHDGLTEFIAWQLGPVRHEISIAELEALGRTLRPSIHWVQTGWAPSDKACSRANPRGPSDRKHELATSERRNAQVLDLARRAHAAGRSVLVLCDLVDHCRDLAEAATARGIPAAALVGKVKRAQRDDILARMRSGDLRVVFATQLADEGLDVPRLDTVVLATPCGNVGRVQQRIGRALRPHPDGQAPVVLDLVDGWGPYEGYARRRRGLYQRLGWNPPSLRGVA